MATTFPIKGGKLQSNLNAANFTIINLDLSGLNLTKASVGLGNVDNTSDANKPISTATLTALNLKENFIAAGTIGQFWRGNKTWVDYGDLALQDGNTTLEELSTIGGSAAGLSYVYTKRNDWASSFAGMGMKYYGASNISDVLVGLSAANAGALEFVNSAYGVILTSNNVPLIFGTSGIERMRLKLGLNVGGTTDPGFGYVQAVQFVGGGAGLTGFTASQIPTTLLATTMPSLRINGASGLGYIRMDAQASVPSVGSAAHIYTSAAARITLGNSGSTTHAISFDNSALTGDCIYIMPNVTAGTLVPRVAVPASAGAAGVAGSIAFTAGQAYFCVAANTWQRVAIATW